jgi:hypothetical protein
VAFAHSTTKSEYPKIVMPMCKFGCDELFEKGLVLVLDSRVVRRADIKTTVVIEKYIEKIIGRVCVYWNEDTKDYFNWHYLFHTNQLK